jgi:pimeloyl-ACP methyl ester carboxylesterase
MNWRVWTPVLPLLASSRDVLAPTLPGHLGGPKPPPGAGLTLTSLADWGEAELDRAGLGFPDLVGNSLGALVALELARRGRARRVVAISPAGMYSGAQLEAILRRGSRLRQLARSTLRAAPVAMRSSLVRRLSLREIAVRADRLPAELALELVTAFASCDLAAMLHDGNGTGQPPLMVLHPDQIDVPVLILWGDRDEITGHDQIQRYMTVLPNARLVELPGLGHCAQLDDPNRVATEVLEFLAP